MWDGVRNYQARNFMRDSMKIDDLVLFYHSNANPPAVVGIAKVCSEPKVDPTAFDKNDSHFDPKSKKENPTWILVDICFVSKFKKIVPLDLIKSTPELNGMVLASKGSRLSVQPVSQEHFEKIVELSNK
jgi:predicted RNA-binding protein with PUA-like domain